MSAADAAKSKRKRETTAISRKLDAIEQKLEVVQAEVIPSDELGERRKLALGRKNENDVVELELREEARDIILRSGRVHMEAMAGYMDKIHNVLGKVSPNAATLPNYIEMARCAAELGDQVLDLQRESKKDAPNVQQINIGLLSGSVVPESQEKVIDV